MLIGERLRSLRKQKKLTQGDIEKRTGLHRAYISRVEQGRVTPKVKSLEKLARGLGVRTWELFYNGDKPPKFKAITFRNAEPPDLFGAKGKHAAYWHRLCRLLARIDKSDRQILLLVLRKMAPKDD